VTSWPRTRNSGGRPHTQTAAQSLGAPLAILIDASRGWTTAALRCSGQRALVSQSTGQMVSLAAGLQTTVRNARIIPTASSCWRITQLVV